MKPETAFKNKVMPALKAIPDSAWESIQQRAIKGTADLFGCVRGRFVGLEFKKSINTPDHKTAKLQRHKLEKFREAGGYTKTVYPENFDEVYKELVTGWGKW